MSEPAWQPLIADAPVLLNAAEGIAEIVFNRPEAANGMTVEFLIALHNAIATVAARSDIRVVILRGAGKHFCAGGDVKVFASKGENLPAYLVEATRWLADCTLALTRLGPPVIASVHGFAAGGGGFGLVCATDLVIASESAQFLTGATRAGMAPDAGASVTLTRLVGFRTAMALVLRNTALTAAEALHLGLINETAPDAALRTTTLTLARELAEGAPLALAAAKRLMWAGLTAPLETALPDEAHTVSELSGSADAREALAAIIERRKPRFTGA